MLDDKNITDEDRDIILHIINFMEDKGLLKFLKRTVDLDPYFDEFENLKGI